jgi:hypothetical protein
MMSDFLVVRLRVLMLCLERQRVCVSSAIEGLLILLRCHVRRDRAGAHCAPGERLRGQEIATLEG